MLNSVEREFLDLLRKGYPNEEIMRKLSIKRSDLIEKLRILERHGYVIDKKIYSNGKVAYELGRSYPATDKTVGNPIQIITSQTEQEMTFVVMGDTHIGNGLDNVVALNKLYDYCKKNGIHYVIHCGDIIDGTGISVGQRLTDIEEQADLVRHNYPYDEDIHTIAIGGNHDYSALTSFGFNIIEYLRSYRDDFIIRDFFDDIITIKNDSIRIAHGTHSDYNNNMRLPIEVTCPVVFYGHSHSFKITQDQICKIKVPTLSDMTGETPSALVVRIIFRKGTASKIKSVIVKKINIGDKIEEEQQAKYDITNDISNPYTAPVEDYQSFIERPKLRIKFPKK